MNKYETGNKLIMFEENNLLFYVFCPTFFSFYLSNSMEVKHQEIFWNTF